MLFGDICYSAIEVAEQRKSTHVKDTVMRDVMYPWLKRGREGGHVLIERGTSLIEFDNPSS